MKPCTNCGLAIHNNADACAECGAGQDNRLQSPARTNESERKPQKEPVSLAETGTELCLRGIIAGLIPAGVAVLVLYFIIPLKYAILVGVLVGLGGFAYSMIESHFQNQI